MARVRPPLVKQTVSYA